MSIDAAPLYKDLGLSAEPPRAVLRADNTIGENPNARQYEAQFSDEVDHLFGARPAYVVLKKEKPRDRMILWMTLQSQRVPEIATALRCTPQTVRNVQKQPWFQDAFCKLAAELGKDSVQVFLQGQVMPALLRTVELATNGETDAVKLAANREILDRFLGKSVVKAEVTTTSTVDMTVADVTTLMAERAQLDQKMRANGLLTGTN